MIGFSTNYTAFALWYCEQRADLEYERQKQSFLHLKG